MSVSHFGELGSPELGAVVRVVAGLIAGFGIGVVAALMGGELLIPTIVNSPQLASQAAR